MVWCRNGRRDAVFVLCLVSLAVSVFAGCVAPVEDDEGPSTVAALSCPAPCGTAIDSGRRWEPHVAVDPTDPSHMVASSQDLSKVPGALLAIHWPLAHVTFDGGATWQTVRIPGGPDEDPSHPLYRYNAMDDSVVMFLPDGTLLWSAIARTRVPPDGIPGTIPASVVVLRSHDGGLTFPDAVVVQEGSGWGTDGMRIHEDYQDKQWSAVLPDGRPFLVWSRNYNGHPDCGSPTLESCTEVVFSVSADGGATWPAPRVIEGDGTFSGAFPVIRSDGGWVVSYHDTNAREVRVAVSTDEGATWTVGVVDRSTKFPVMAAVDEAQGERIYLAYPAGEGDRDDAQVVTLRWSDDGGLSWSGPRVLGAPQAPGRTIPAIARAGDDGVVVLYWHPLAEGAELHAVAVRNGTRSETLVVATMEGPSSETGDYMGLAPLPDGDVYAVWNEVSGDTFTVTGTRLVVG